jgi:hypothetical protein
MAMVVTMFFNSESISSPTVSLSVRSAEWILHLTLSYAKSVTNVFNTVMTTEQYKWVSAQQSVECVFTIKPINAPSTYILLY